MGFFSWKTSDTNRSISNRWSERGAFPVHVLCPDGTVIREDDYDGYGVFGGHDIYELVAEWNRENITVTNLRKPERSRWAEGEEGEVWYQRAVVRYDRECQMLQEFKDGKPDSFMARAYGEDWKRILGVHIACYDDQNAALEFPIKIVEDPSIPYEEAKPSASCPYQGYFYGWDDEEDEDCW